MDGAVYDWSVQVGKREREYILKSCSYTSLAFTADLKTTFAVGTDRTLNQINLQDSSVSIKLFQLFLLYFLFIIFFVIVVVVIFFFYCVHLPFLALIGCSLA